jgi:hypothetical protein
LLLPQRFQTSGSKHSLRAEVCKGVSSPLGHLLARPEPYLALVPFGSFVTEIRHRDAPSVEQFTVTPSCHELERKKPYIFLVLLQRLPG